MATQELSPNNLRAALDDFSRTHQGCRTLLEDSAPNQERREVRNLPLLGISADDRDGEDQIVILLGDQPDHHLSHIVSHPSKVRIIDGNPNEETIQIQAHDGRQVIVHCYKGSGINASSSQADQRESGEPGGGAGRIDEVGHSGVYPASHAAGASAGASYQGEASWGQGSRGAEGYFDHGDSELNLGPEKKGQ